MLSLRHRLRRHPLLVWLVAVTATLAGARWAEGPDPAGAQLAGEQVEVLVATRPIAAGEVLGPADSRRRLVPAAGRPEARPAEDPTGKTARADLAAGEVLLAHHLASGLGPAGGRLLTIGVDGPRPTLRPGDLVDVLATFDLAEVAGEGQGHAATDPTVVVAAGATVAEVADGAVTVAVPAEVAPRLAFAMARATITLARR